MINAYLLRKRVDAAFVKGITAINLIVFGAVFVVMAVFTFLPPIIFSGLIFGCLTAAFFSNREKETSVG